MPMIASSAHRPDQFRKYFKGRVKDMVPRAALDFGSVGLQSLEVARVTAKQMLAIRMVRLWARVSDYLGPGLSFSSSIY